MSEGLPVVKKQDYFGAVYWGALAAYCAYLAIAGSQYMPAVAAGPMVYAILALAVFWLAAGIFHSITLIFGNPAMFARAFVDFIGRERAWEEHREEREWSTKTFANIFFAGLLLAIAYAIYILVEPAEKGGIFSPIALAMFVVSFLQIFIATFPREAFARNSKGKWAEWAANARSVGEIAGTTSFFCLLLLFFLWAILGTGLEQKQVRNGIVGVAEAVVLQFLFFLFATYLALGKNVGGKHVALAIALLAAFHMVGAPGFIRGMQYAQITLASFAFSYLALALSAWDGWKKKNEPKQPAKKF